MTFKEQLEATVQEGRDYNAITAEVKETLLAAAKSGESSVFLPLTDEHGYKVGAICHFLENENIKFKKIYDSRQVEKSHYLDPHYQETVVRNGGKSMCIHVGVRLPYWVLSKRLHVLCNFGM